ncbi:hypothetical protein [Deinococcus multiflagellatus]|uniref:Uncharacterized protein n=1 Tax=Deinococcus multiflagellatus TaxID=1656887 RepID=A0ABW1ZMJ7_9DEIO|nr:hypothetical protein [Deinococcus multiflagellatus]MBZ9715099.1 hypothetical protein [Deinococcus multiflagellatus]
MGEGKPGHTPADEPNVGVSQMEQLSSTTDPAHSKEEGGLLANPDVADSMAEGDEDQRRENNG